jgi:actin-related protein 5
LSDIRFQTLITKLKTRARRRLELTDRKSAATQARMKNIANLASDDRGVKKKRKTGGGESLTRFCFTKLTAFVEDMFGADDADWEAYRKIVGLGVVSLG